MSAPIYYKAVSRLTGTLEYCTDQPDWMLGWAQNNRDHLALWNVIESYPDANDIVHRAEDWLRDRMPAFEPPDAPMPPFDSAQSQDTLKRALDRYNERYDNTLYLAATHSIRSIEDTPEYIQECIRVQDCALWICGADNAPCVSPTRITREMVIFWHAFASDQQYNFDANHLPF